MGATVVAGSLFVDAYTEGIRTLLQRGSRVPSVRDPLSKASNFGKGDRPAIEILAHTFEVDGGKISLPDSPTMKIHLPYAIGLLAWSLAGRSDVQTLAYYRRAAMDYSDDGHTLCGAFGARLLAENGSGIRQIDSILTRMRRDPASRRTFASIARADDNWTDSKEYPCAAGIQLFLRDGRLDFLTVMRAQQAITVLPYDYLLFSGVHQWLAAMLGVPPGRYIHFSGTYHIYVDEIPLAERLIEETSELRLPPIVEQDPEEFPAYLDEMESQIRGAAVSADREALSRLGERRNEPAFLRLARESLTGFAEEGLGPA